MNVEMLLTGVAIKIVALCFGPFGELCYLPTEMIHTCMQPDGTCTRYKPLFTKINGKLKEKFISNEFVDMTDILDPPSDLEPFDFYLWVKHNGWLRPASTKLIYVYSIIKSKIIVQV